VHRVILVETTLQETLVDRVTPYALVQGPYDSEGVLHLAGDAMRSNAITP
jgi:hypothetical protein